MSKIGYGALIALMIGLHVQASYAGVRKGDTFYAWVDHVTLRAQEQSSSSTVGYLKEGQLVKFLATSSEKRVATLRGETFDQYYYKVKYNKNRVAWVYGGALKPFLVKSDSRARKASKACVKNTRLIDKIWRSHTGHEDASRLSNEKIARFVQSVATGDLIYQQVSPPEQCAGTFPVLQCYDGGVFESSYFVSLGAVSSAYRYQRLLVFSQAFPAFFGLSIEASQEEIRAQLGKPFKVYEDYVMYVSEQPEDEAKDYFESKYEIFIFFADAKIRFLVVLEHYEAC